MRLKNKKLAQIALLVVFSGQVLISTEAANILFYLGNGSPSHRLAMQPLANTLATRGHNITFLVQEDASKIKISHPNIQIVVAEKVRTYFTNLRSNGFTSINFYNMRATEGFFGALGRNLFIQTFGIKVCEHFYTDPKIMEWISSTPKFDLVIIDGLFNECGYGLAHLHRAKTIIFSVSTLLPWVLESMGMPDETAWIPNAMLSMPLDMSFKDRVVATIMPVFWRMFRDWYYFPTLEKITREELNMPNFPSFAELERNTSLVFANIHASQELPRALPPNVIPVGGMSWEGNEKRKPLPQKMIDFINQGKEGFIYVSFGSFIDFLTFPEEVQQTFINALKQFPNIQFIWKLNKTPENLPNHIMVEKWMPQQELLSHPKIRAFITHSGIGGVTEAIYSAVPLICFPVITEQDYNALIMEKQGVAIKMEITALTQEGMVEAIRKMLTDNSYKKNIQRVTKQFLDRPMKPVDTAVWYTEFVLRQDNTEYLRSHNIDLVWWKKRQLDVWLFVLLITITLNSLGLYISYRIFKRCFNSSNKNISRKSGKGKQKQN